MAANDKPWAIGNFNRVGLEHSSAYTAPPHVADCTLRDGEQQAGVVFSREDKIALAQTLDALGVHELEVGTPAVSDDDRLAIEAIASLGLAARLSALSRARKDDVDLVASTGVGAVRLSLPISDRQRRAKLNLDDKQYVRLALEISAYAKGLDLEVIFSPYDTTRCDAELLGRLLRSFARERCVDRVRLVDTTGAASPEAIRYLVRFMLDAGDGLPIEVHCHDDFGLATANTIAGALAGAAYLSTTMNGLGERSGNAALEEVVMGLLVLYGVDLGIRTERLSNAAAEVEHRSGIRLQPHKAVVGANSFCHETGMVVAGLAKDPFTAETYAPELVGQKRSIVLGKKSGRASLELKLPELGLRVESELLLPLLDRVKARAIELKRGLTDHEVRELVAELQPPTAGLTEGIGDRFGG
jgi:isopropylmalate/homocitrate/citramalate synthase